MSYNYTLRYRTFDQLLSEILVDFQNYSLQNMIEPQTLIKVAKRVNYDLGLRIMMTKGTLLEVEKNRVKLPDDFYSLNYALICDDVTVTTSLPQGTHIEEIPVYKEQPAVIDVCAPPTVNCAKCNLTTCACGQNTIPLQTACSTTQYNPLEPYGSYCNKPRVFVNCKNDCYELVQIVHERTETYKRLIPIKILPNNENVDCNCPNLYVNSQASAWIQNGFLYTNFECAKVYISYQGALEDDQGNLLVPDHDLLNEYYEYALKQRVLEILIMNDETVNQAKIQLIEKGHRESRNKALSLVNTPNFAEMRRVFEMNRKAMYIRYYDMFKSYPYMLQDDRILR